MMRRALIFYRERRNVNRKLYSYIERREMGVVNIQMMPTILDSPESHKLCIAFYLLAMR